MSKLAALHKKYEFDTPISELHEPDPDCRKCHGEGEYPHPNGKGLTFCMCLFIEGQSLRDWVAPNLVKAAKQALDAHQRYMLYEGNFQAPAEHYYIVAPNLVVYQKYCENRSIPKHRAHYLDSEKEIMSLSDVKIAIVDRDQHGFFDWPQSKRRVVERVFERTRIKIIDYEWVAVEV